MVSQAQQYQDEEMKNRLLFWALQELGKKGVYFEDMPDDLALPMDLQNDKEFIVSLTRSKFIHYNDLPSQWKGDIDVACSMFEPSKIDRTRKHDHANVCFLDMNDRRTRLWKSLSYQLQTNEQVVLCALRSSKGPSFSKVHSKFHSNASLLCTALLHEKIKFDDIPDQLKRTHPEIASHGIRHNLISADECDCLDESFFKQVLEDDEIEWEWLPAYLVDNSEFAASITDFSKNNDLPKEILERFFEYRADKSFWSRLMQPGVAANLNTLIEEFAPVELLSDREFMLEACRLKHRNFTLISGDLVDSIEFLEEVLLVNPAVLQYVSHEVQHLHGDLVLKTLHSLEQLEIDKKVVDEFCYYIAKLIHPDFWLNFDFAKAWVGAGLGFPCSGWVERGVERAWLRNRSLCLLNAIKTKSLYHANWCSFTSEVSFMREVVMHHPELYFEAKGEAKRDPMIMVAAFSACPQIAHDEVMQMHLQGRDDEISSIVECLQSFYNYQVFVLGNMLSTQSVEDTGSPLTLLNQGHETSLVYKKKIAGYLGLPTGLPRISQLRQAKENVLKTIAAWSTSF